MTRILYKKDLKGLKKLKNKILESKNAIEKEQLDAFNNYIGFPEAFERAGKQKTYDEILQEIENIIKS